MAYHKNTGLFLLLIAMFLFIRGDEDLDKINKRIKTINNKLTELSKEKKSILNEIYKIELQYEKEAIKKGQLRSKIVKISTEIGNKEKEKKRLLKDIDKSKDKVARIARILYKMRGNSYFTLFTKINSMDQLFKNYQLFATLINHNMTEISNIKNNFAKLQVIQKQLKTKQNYLLDLKKTIDKKMVIIRGLKANKVKILKEINQDRQLHLKYIEELNVKARNLNSIIDQKKITIHHTIANLNDLKGKLIWPVKGKVTSSFGKKRSTRFNTYILDNGIKISPSGSFKIRSVYQGVVVWAQYYKGYGNLIVVQHSKNFRSFYGHCEKILVKPGDNILKNDIIGIVGDTGAVQAKSLYFEIRNKIIALDPLKWLSKR